MRTLVLAKRDLLEPEYNTWRAKFAIAMCAMVDRQEQKENCYNDIERNLVLLGATAIEDRLQVSRLCPSLVSPTLLPAACPLCGSLCFAIALCHLS